MRRLGIAAVLVLAAVLLILTIAQSDEGGPDAMAREAGRPEEVLMQTDAAFDLATSRDGIEGWVSFFAEDGAMMPPGAHITRGLDAIRAVMEPAFATPGYSLRWKPAGAEIASSGDLGYTYGTYTSTSPSDDGKPVVRHGKYITIWKKQADGSWKAVMDAGNASPGPASTAVSE
jgi:ketosteroid isomerase-like protein